MRCEHCGEHEKFCVLWKMDIRRRRAKMLLLHGTKPYRWKSEAK